MNGKEWYRQQLATAEWKAKRREIYERDNGTCVDCQSSGCFVHCHHEYYVRGMKPWEYPSHALVILCEDCHERRHKYVIKKFASHDDAEMWIIFCEIDRAMIEFELRERDARIEQLEEQHAVWDSEGRYYAIIDEDGQQKCFDEDGNLM